MLSRGREILLVVWVKEKTRTHREDQDTYSHLEALQLYSHWSPEGRSKVKLEGVSHMQMNEQTLTSKQL